MAATVEPRPITGTGDFLFRFGVSAVVVMTLLAVLAPARRALISFTIWSIQSSAGLMRLDAWSGDDGLMTFASPASGAFSYRVVEECTAIAVIGLYSVAIFAMPGVTWRRRWVGLLVGSAALLTVNWMRLLSLAWLGVHRPATFDLAHVWLWQAIGVALVVVAWLVWLRWASGSATEVGGSHNWLWFSVTAGALTLLSQVSDLRDLYSQCLDWAVEGVQRAVSALPYRTLSFAASASDWTVQLRWVSLTIAVALAAALTGPTLKRRLTSGALAVALVPLTQLVGTLFEAASDARLELAGGQAFASFVQIPLLVVVHGLPALIPLSLWFHTQLSQRTSA